MTRKKAIEMLEYIRYIGNGESEYKNCAQGVAIDMAIKALESCEEYITEIYHLRKYISKLETQIIEQDNADTCYGCAFEDVEAWEMPCSKCKRNCKDYWRKKAESEV